jgi:hypothetical protein
MSSTTKGGQLRWKFECMAEWQLRELNSRAMLWQMSTFRNQFVKLLEMIFKGLAEPRIDDSNHQIV